MGCVCQYLGKLLKPFHSNEPTESAHLITNPPNGYRRGSPPSVEWTSDSMDMDDCLGRVFVWGINGLAGWVVGPKNGTGL